MPGSTDINFAKQLTLKSQTEVDPPVPAAPMTDQQELQSLKEIIISWRQIESEVAELNSQMREKKKRQKTLEEMILRIMKKHNIGALDLKGSGGRLLYRRQTTKGTLNVKTITELLTQHMKSETAAAEAMEFINKNRGAKVKESILYEN
jgi:hypothetical protein|uniref:Uncharacterized protein n=1 Tax=viral metagenome TaxID=1070528 RepID=A0A6C0JWA4_9ZZZZ